MLNHLNIKNNKGGKLARLVNKKKIKNKKKGEDNILIL